MRTLRARKWALLAWGLLGVICIPLIGVTLWLLADALDGRLLDSFDRAVSDRRLFDSLARTAGIATLAVGLEIILALVVAVRWRRPLSYATVAIFCAPLLVPTVSLALGLQLGVQIGQIADAGTSGAAAWHLALFDHPAIVFIMIDMWQWTPPLVLVLVAQKIAVDPVHIASIRLMGARAYAAWFTMLRAPWGAVITLFLCFRLLDWFRMGELPQILYGAGGQGLGAELFSVYFSKVSYWPDSNGYAALIALLWSVTIVLTVRGFLIGRLAALFPAERSIGRGAE